MTSKAVDIDDGEYKEMSSTAFGDTRAGAILARILNEKKDIALRKQVSSKIHKYFHRLKAIRESRMEPEMKIWALEHAYKDYLEQVYRLRVKHKEVDTKVKTYMQNVGRAAYARSRREAEDVIYYYYNN